jgi:hypothetical protein
MSLLDKIDAVIIARGCDPHYHHPDGRCVVGLQDDADGGGPFIAHWSPPDPSYGDAPTAAEIAAVSHAAADAAATLRRQVAAQQRLDSDPTLIAILDAVADVANLDSDALKAATVERLA